MTELIRSLFDQLEPVGLRTEDGGIGGLILAVLVVIAIVVIALIQWVF
jgi:hypothetical protein